MRRAIFYIFCIAVLMLTVECRATSVGGTNRERFVSVDGDRFVRDGNEYTFHGANMWYAAILGSEGQGGDRARLCRELDTLKSRGIMNLRVLAGGSDGLSQRESHTWPSLQPKPGVYNDTLLVGLDFLMAELERRHMTAVLFLNNSWDWSGGFGTYLEWAGQGEAPEGSQWTEFERYHSQFTRNEKAMKMAADHTRFMVSRTNTITGKPYTESPALMAWEIANEPRPFSNKGEVKESFLKWIESQARLIKSIDKNHLVTTGSEGYYGCAQDTSLLRRVHAVPEIDYCTIHIWPHNWSWLGPCIGDTKQSRERNGVTAPQDSLPRAMAKTRWYLQLNYDVLSPLGKPIVIEEFGYPRDNYSITPGSPVSARLRYYKYIYELSAQPEFRGFASSLSTNFWGWGGEAQPQHERWQRWDTYVADPAQEEQGLYSVFTIDK